jgi:hypothetical protein
MLPLRSSGFIPNFLSNIMKKGRCMRIKLIPIGLLPRCATICGGNGGKGLAEGNLFQQSRFLTQSRSDLQHALRRIRQAALISETTVKVHRGRVMEKLVVGSVAELVCLSQKARIEPAQISGI